jgi:hypothetical protein
MKSFLKLLITLTLLMMISSENINIFEQSEVIQYPNIKKFVINFTELKKSTPNFFVEHAFLSVIANTTSNTECNKKSGVKIKLFIFYLIGM